MERISIFAAKNVQKFKCDLSALSVLKPISNNEFLATEKYTVKGENLILKNL